jgi:glycosyltransferase involved in cell wall biosynthesis
MPELRVGYLARGGVGKARFPWAQYSYPVSQQWGENYIQDAWEDLSQDRQGIIFTIWDATRLLWFAQPVDLPEKLQSFLTGRKFKRWGYFMQDSEGVAPGVLPLGAASVMSGYDRVLLASKWAYDMTSRSILGHPDIDWLPHGMILQNFTRVDRSFARSGWALDDSARVVGCVMSNQERKQWAVVLEAIARTPNTWLWMHPDMEVNYWNLPALVHEYGLENRVKWEKRHLSDKELAMRYSACDMTVVMSGGEGFCYPAAESLACGTRVVAGSYGAQHELIGWGIQPRAFEIHTQHAVRMAVYSAHDLVQAIRDEWENPHERMSVDHLAWEKIGRVWKKWVKAGLK